MRNKIRRRTCLGELYRDNKTSLGGGEELILPKLTAQTFHVSVNIGNPVHYFSNATFFFSARNPIDRVVSALGTNHTMNKKGREKAGSQRSRYDDVLWAMHCGFNTAQDLADGIEYRDGSNDKYIYISLSFAV